MSCFFAARQHFVSLFRLWVNKNSFWNADLTWSLRRFLWYLFLSSPCLVWLCLNGQTECSMPGLCVSQSQIYGLINISSGFLFAFNAASLQVCRNDFYYRRYLTHTVLINVTHVHLRLSQFIFSPSNFFCLNQKTRRNSVLFYILLWISSSTLNNNKQQHTIRWSFLFSSV